MRTTDRRELKATILQALQAGMLKKEQADRLGLGDIQLLIRSEEEELEAAAAGADAEELQPDTEGNWKLDRYSRRVLINWLQEVVQTGDTEGPAAKKAGQRFAGHILIITCKTREAVEQLQDLRRLGEP